MSLVWRFLSRWQNWFSVLLLLLFVSVALAAPYLSPEDPKTPGAFMRVGKATEGRPLPPDEKAPLGMLPFGVDVYHALIWGSRDALRFGVIVALSTAIFGVFYGAVSGFVGNRLGNLMIRVSDSFLAFPPIAGLVFFQQLYMATIQSMGGRFMPTGEIYSFSDTPLPVTFIQSLLDRVDPLMLSLILLSWMPYARLVHSIVLTLKQTEFVQAARALGGSNAWIIRKHILRNSTGPAIVLAARDVGGVVLLQATLTFVQIGGNSIWGSMLSQGRNWVIGAGGNLMRYWWVFLPPTLAVMLFGIAWNMFGDGLNDALEPGAQGGARRGFFWRRRKNVEPLSAPEEQAPLSTPLPAARLRQEPVPQPVEQQQTSPTKGSDPILVTARGYASQGDLPQALHGYRFLIQRGRSLDEALPDLARLAKNHPGTAEVWQTLGDALARAGRSEQAAQSYEQARKLRDELPSTIPEHL